MRQLIETLQVTPVIELGHEPLQVAVPVRAASGAHVALFQPPREDALLGPLGSPGAAQWFGWSNDVEPDATPVIQL